MYRRFAPYINKLIETPVAARFDHQCRIDDGDAVRVLRLAFAEPPVLFFYYERVDDRVQKQPFFFVREYYLAELRAVKLAAFL